MSIITMTLSQVTLGRKLIDYISQITDYFSSQSNLVILLSIIMNWLDDLTIMVLFLGSLEKVLFTFPQS